MLIFHGVLTDNLGLTLIAPGVLHQVLRGKKLLEVISHIILLIKGELIL